MLPAASRLRRRPEFVETIRRGRRSGRARLVVHLLDVRSDDDCTVPARAGFVVGRAVGGAVVRNRVRRQLRHLVADRMSILPQGCRLVVRALPAAAGSSSAELERDLDAALTRACRTRFGHVAAADAS